MKTAQLTAVITADATKFKADLARATASGKRFLGAFRAPPGMQKVANFATGMAKSVGSRALTLGFYGAIAGVTALTRETLQFDNSIRRAYANLAAGGETGTKVYNDLYKATYEVGKATEFTAAQAAEGASVFAQAGFNISEIGSLLPEVARLSTAAGVDIATAADWASTQMLFFGERAKGPEATANSFKKISDVISVVVAQGKLDFAEFANTMEYTGGVAKSLEMSFEDTAATVGLMSMVGLKASKAGTNMRSMYIGLQKANKGGAADMMKELGVETWSGGKFKGINQTLAELNDAMRAKGWNLEKKFDFVQKLFPKTALPGGTGMMSFKPDQIIKYMEALDNVNGKTKEMSDIIRGSLPNKFKLLWSAVTSLGITVLTKYRGEIVAWIDTMIEWVNSVNPDDIAFYFKQVWSGIKEMIPAIKGAIPDLKEFTKAIIGFGVQGLKVIGPVLAQVTPHLDKILLMWLGKQGSDAITSIRDMAAALASMAGAIKWGLPLFASLIALVNPYVLIFAGLAGIISICASEWDAWMSNLNSAGWQRLAQYMAEIKEVIKSVAGFFGFGMFDQPATRRQTYESGRAEWEADHAGLGARFDDVRFFGQMPQQWIDEQGLKMGGASGDWRQRLGVAPVVPEHLMGASLPNQYGPRARDGESRIGNLPTAIADAIKQKVLLASPNIYINAAGGIGVTVDKSKPGNSMKLGFNHGGKN